MDIKHLAVDSLDHILIRLRELIDHVETALSHAAQVQLLEPLQFELKRISQSLVKRKPLTPSMQLESFFDLSLDMLCIAGMDGLFKRINRAFCTSLGHSMEEMLAQPFLNFIHPDDREGTLREMANLSSGMKTLNFQNRYRCFDGSYRIFSWTGIFEPESQSLYCTARDMTDFHRALEARQKAEQRLETMSGLLERTGEMAQIGGWELDLISHSQVWSHQFHRIFDLDPAVVPDMELFLKFFAPDNQEILRSALKTGIEQGTPYECALWATTSSGRRIWLRVQGLAIQHDGKPIRMVGSFQDLTDQKKSEDGLKAALEFNQSLFNAMTDGFSVLDAQGIAQDVNANFCRMTGFSRDELLGVGAPYPYWPPEEYANIQAAFDQTFENKFRNFELIFMKKSGERFPVLVSPSSIKNSAGEILYYVGTVQDITEKKAQEAQLKQAELKVMQSSKLASLGVMSAGIAHEINNPLTIILGMTRLLSRDSKDSEKSGKAIEAIQKSGTRIARIVQGLKKFSRTNSEANCYQTKPLATIIRDVVGLMEAKARHVDTELQCELQSESSILCDEVEIEQVLINLIHNAIDAVKDQTHRWVKIRNFDEGGAIVLQIIDSGFGIPLDVQKKLFDPFFTTKMTNEGTGLGLSITKGILDEHKAHIRYCLKGPHTCFEVRFEGHGVRFHS